MAVLTATLAACSSTASSGTQTAASDPIPASAFSDHTGVTPTSVTVANISTQTAGLFKGALVGAQAYAAYVNSTGGVNGRKIVVQGEDDQFNGSTNKQLTQQAVDTDFATVGDVSLEDGFGGTVLAANPGFPNVSASLDPVTRKLPTTFSAMPSGQGWPLGALVYFAKRFPTEIAHTATVVANLPSTVLAWSYEKQAMEHEGYHVVYDARPAGVPDRLHGPGGGHAQCRGPDRVPRAGCPRTTHPRSSRTSSSRTSIPTVVLGSPAYSSVLVANSGGPSAIDGAFFEQQSSFYLGEDAAAIPAVSTFDTWVAKTAPGFSPDLFTFEGWLHAELFAQALSRAGADPSRGSLLKALRAITSVQQREPHPGQQSGQEGPDHLLRPRPDPGWPVRPDGRPADLGSHPRLPVRPAVLQRHLSGVRTRQPNHRARTPSVSGRTRRPGRPPPVGADG